MAPTFGLLKDLAEGRSKFALKLRVVRVYDQPQYNNKNEIASLECVMHDSTFGNINEIPKDIEDLVNKTALFKVQVREGQKQGYTGSYSVCKIIDDKDDVSKYCDYYSKAKEKNSKEPDVKNEEGKVVEGEANENESEEGDSCNSTISPQLSESPATKKIRKAA